MKNLMKRFVNEEAGQDLVEYALLLGLIAVATVTIIGTLQTAIEGRFQASSDALGS